MSEAGKNWKTTLGGILLGVGTLLAAGDGWYQLAGQVMMGIGGLLVGVAASDAKKA